MQKTIYQTLDELKVVMFNHLRNDDDLDMEDLQCMWEALFLRRKIPLPAEWDFFLERVNSVYVSNNFDAFNDAFNAYISTEVYNHFNQSK